jgi:putative transposase
VSSFFGLIKQEIYYGETLKAFDELREKIEWFVHYYNHERRKKKLAGLSPVNYRTQTSQQAA